MAEVITITSGKGGVGKSTATANLAVGIAEEIKESGKKVVAVDFDIGLRNLDMLLGLENRIVYDVIDVMEGKCNLSQALIMHKKTRNLYFLPASQTKDKTILDKEKVRKLLEELRAQFDYILIDSPAGIEGGFEHAILWADRALIVVTPEVSSVRDSDRVIGIIDAKSHKAQNNEEVQKHIIINRIKPDLVKKGEMLSQDDVLGILALPLIGLIPEDSKIITATNSGEPVIYTQSPSAKAYARIAKRILGQEVAFESLESEGVINTLKRIFQ
ncbi:septum site-determining protein MinD [Helicobacter sp. MIT 05-5293]|uniref:Septum site-determining protein MinD n=1 Tax=uncultured Helicobacter sp. TaxID=175537 RepID=A0A650EKB2_9HELI|nr:septum site-determining protein MinD [Helicobacter sp. MIT 05-5293]QGT50197.1 septum site-determining protein MinD [uncultured Helicobacter sp.]TLD80838.1 septum site-determining protein MinD [Helicobacter sp. MIT 05-5293]